MQDWKIGKKKKSLEQGQGVLALAAERDAEMVLREQLAKEKLPCREAGHLGGRPLVPLQDRRGASNKVDGSNRIYPGQARRKHELTLSEGISICRYLNSQKEAFASEAAFWTAMLIRYRPMAKQALEAILNREEFYETHKEQYLVGAAGRGRHLVSRIKTSKGMRLPGGGRMDQFKAFKEEAKHFAERERSCGHTLSP